LLSKVLELNEEGKEHTMRAHSTYKQRLLATIALVATVSSAASARAQTADTIYTGGAIVTINDKQPTAEAVAVKGGKIVAVGTRTEVEKAHKGTSTTARTSTVSAMVPSSLSIVEATTSSDTEIESSLSEPLGREKGAKQ
jgi:hypothetical protein